MTNYDAISSAVALMETWATHGVGAANDRVTALAGTPAAQRELIVGLVNLSACLLALREHERDVAPRETLEEIQSRPWHQ